MVLIQGRSFQEGCENLPHHLQLASEFVDFFKHCCRTSPMMLSEYIRERNIIKGLINEMDIRE